MQPIFLTETMKTGGSLLSNLISIHSKVIIIYERFHFFKFSISKNKKNN